MTTEQEELFKADEVVKLIIDSGLSSIRLVGGAVLDILSGKIPKDYDFLGTTEEQVFKLGFKYSHDTKTATTYIKDNLILQRLKTDINDFDFKISQTNLFWDYSKKMQLIIDETSFENKVLIPCDRCWTEKKNALNSLRRLPHWREKGYKINDVTYLSLLSIVGKNNNINS